MISRAAAERGPVRRSPLRRAPRTIARAAFAVFTALVVLSGAGPASAGLLLASSTSLASGTAVVTRCGNLDTAAISYDLEGGNVIAVTVSALPATCNGAALGLALATTGAPATAGPVTVSGGRALLYPLSSTPAYGSITDARLCLVG